MKSVNQVNMALNHAIRTAAARNGNSKAFSRKSPLIVTTVEKQQKEHHRKKRQEEEFYVKNVSAKRDMSISVGSQIIFRYEVNRLVSDLYEGGMRKFEYPRVPHEDIEIKLNQVLPKYVNFLGYTCSTLKVTDHEEDTVLITLNGVSLI